MRPILEKMIPVEAKAREAAAHKDASPAK